MIETSCIPHKYAAFGARLPQQTGGLLPTQSIPDRYRPDHLLLLVGANPLPNLVSALLLAKPQVEGRGAHTKIWLLHSDGQDGEPSTIKAAQALEGVLRRKLPNPQDIRLHPIPSSSRAGIEKAIISISDQLTGKVGLNYTGGTKPMAVHTYRTLERCLGKHTRLVCSYLDPRRLALRFDYVEGLDREIVSILSDPTLRQVIDVSLDDLAALHGYLPTTGEVWADPRSTPYLLDLIQAIAHVHSSIDGFEAWRCWLATNPFTDLPSVVKYPDLAPVCAAFDLLCGGVGLAQAEQVACKIKNNPTATLENCRKWFIGIWLEEYTLSAIQSSNIKPCGRGKKYKPSRIAADFDLDVAALFGYQLFAMSCIATRERAKAKEHLFEIYVRARQLGGDEARIALVCCVDDPSSLRDELERTWDAEGKLTVFGRNDLMSLPMGLDLWFRTANK